MTVPTPANYVFLPWVRQGAASGIQTPDSLSANQVGVVSLPVKLRINDTDDIDRQVRLHGPGDVTGIDPQQVVRTEPHHLAMDFEPNYFPAIDFDRPDFPWLFTPASADASGRLRPWLCLVVVRKQQGVSLRVDRSLPLPVLEIQAPAQPGRELPDLAESWAWAHVQVSGSLREAASLKASLAGDPALTASRLLCPRRLDPATDYLACVVPAFELGRKAGLGLPIAPTDEQKLEPAWVLGPQAPPQVTLPVFFHWEFRTGAGGDFEQLVRLLEPRPMPPEVGKRPMDISQPGFGIVPPPLPGTTLELEGALRLLSAQTAEWPQATRSPFQNELKRILNAPRQAMQAQDHEPLLAPPIYGSWLAAQHLVETTPDPPASPPSPPWLHELNLDPRQRAVAALGTKVVQARQEQLMASAWEQLGEIERVNQMRRQAQLGRAVNNVYYAKIFGLFSAEALFSVVAPAQSRIVLAERRPDQASSAPPVKTLLFQKIADSSVPAGVVSAPFRRITRPRGTVSRQFLQAGTPGLGAMLRLFRAAALIPIQPTAGDTGAVTIDKVSAAVSNMVQSAGGFIWNPDPPAHWERPRAALMQMLNLFRLSNLSGSAISARQPPPGIPAEFCEAAKAHHNYLSQAFMPNIAFAPRPALSLVDVRTATLASLDPEKTITARVQASLSLAGAAGRSGDPLEPVLDAPEFPQPIYEALRDLFQDFLFPGLEHVLPNTITLLETNPNFVESFLVGLNTEMSRELLWRGYPTDQRGTCFRRFWDTSAGNGQPDIDRISNWGNRQLGQNAGAGEQLVLLLRGELLRRYPNSVIYAVRAVKTGKELDLSRDPQDELHPIFRGTLKPDVTFIGFGSPLTPEEAIADPGWFFVIQQQPTEPRFGLDAADFENPPPPLTAPEATWNDLSWWHLVKTEEELKVLTHASVKTGLPVIGNVQWGRNSSHQAYITLQRPVRIAVHARDMLLPQED